MSDNLTNFECFMKDAHNDISYYQEKLHGDGSFDYSDQVNDLVNLSNKLNRNLLVHLFGQRLGEHLIEKFVFDCERNLLKFFSKIDEEHKFYILYELKNNEHLFAYS